MRATVIADASFCSRTKAGGWAVWVAYDGGTKGQHSGMFRSRPPSSGIAELQAVLNGLWIAHQNGARDILIQTDCMSVVHAINGVGAYAKLYRDAHTKHFADATVRAKHVKGHTTIADARSWCNRWCDTEAKRHMRKQRGNE
jgi:ribonuclease HI